MNLTEVPEWDVCSSLWRDKCALTRFEVVLLLCYCCVAAAPKGQVAFALLSTTEMHTWGEKAAPGWKFTVQEQDRTPPMH